MTTPSQRRASAAFVAKRRADGWRKITFWVSPETLKQLETSAREAGSKDRALSLALGETK